MYHNSCNFRNNEGKRLALVRHLRELTQKEVGHMIGKSGSYVSGVESGRFEVVDFKPFARALGVTEKYLKEGGNLNLERW